MLLYFSLSLFVSATLLFFVQPMIGKMILPQLGGTPAVWNTCMVFFQGVLLVGYGYTHLLTTTQPTRRQVLIQGALLFSPFLFLMLPFHLGNWIPPDESNPIFSLLWKLTLMVGLPFFMVSTTAPLLQKWFFHTGHPASKDPYFLYGASNLGSMLGLLAYPTIIEPWLMVTPPDGDGTVKTQVHLWTAGYLLFVAMVIGCALVVWKSLAEKTATAEQPAAPPEPAPAPAPTPAPVATAITSSPKRRGARMATPTPAAKTGAATPAANTVAVEAPPNDEITPLRRLRWVGLAAAASSLMLGVTTYMTTDIAAVAFFWIIPLALYLLTFILVFSRWPVVWTGTPHMIVMFMQPCVLLLLVLKMIANLALPERLFGFRIGEYETPFTFVMHLLAFFLTTLMCHGELAKDRPSTKHLTEFYFWMSLGGVLGGLFNALVSPILFQWGILEYTAAMAFACLLRSSLVDQAKTLIPGDSNMEKNTPLGYALDFVIPLTIFILCYLAFWYREKYAPQFFWLGKTYLLAALVVIALALSLRPVRFGLSVGALFLAWGIYEREPYLYEGRGFFGLLRVRETDWEKQPYPVISETGDQLHKKDEHGNWHRQYSAQDQKIYRTLIHGGINHGRQIVHFKQLDPWGEDLPENKSVVLRKRREPITYFHERNGVAELFYKLGWADSQPVSTPLTDMNGMSDFRMPASMFGLACGDFPIAAMLSNTQSEPPFAVLGLGTGILACYAKPFQHVDFFEIDPLVKNLSVVPGYVPPWHPERQKMPKLQDPTFYFVQDAIERGARVEIKLGDGRLKLKDAPEKYYHIIALDAFSSDAIPVHLLTKDAVELYLTKLADGGVLLFNTTNRYVRIERVLAAIAAETDCDCLYCPDYTYGSDHPDRFSADWVVLQPRSKKGTYANGGPPIGLRLETARLRKAWTGRVVTDGERKEKTIHRFAVDMVCFNASPINSPLFAASMAFPGRGPEVLDERWQEVVPMPGAVWTDSYSNMLNPIVMPWIAPWRRR